MRCSVFRASIGLFCFFAIGVAGQSPAPSPGVIAGIVVDSANSPVRRAIVTLSTVEAQPQDAVAWTDANGRFSFGYLPAGRYQLRAVKDGYQGAAYGAETSRRAPATIQLAAGQVRSDFVLRFQLVGSISGVVLDEDGDPLSGVEVRVLRPDFQRGKRTLLPGPMTVTDSNGHYLVSGLAGGKYVVSAMRRNSAAIRIHPEATAGEPQQQYLYGLQYYPAADHAEAATLIPVQLGQQISQIDFRLPARPASSIEGKIIVPPGVAVSDVSVNIANQDLGNQNFIGQRVSAPDFIFNRFSLAPGSYVLIAQASVDGKQYRGVQAVELGPQGVKGIAVPLEPSIDLSGSVSVEGPEAAKYTASFVNLTSGDGIPWNAPPLRANVNKDGSFKISGVPAGIWDIGVSIPPTGYVKSMHLGDQDVLTEEMMIRPSTTEALKIVLSTHAAKLEGDVVQGDQPAQAVVLLAPDGKARHVFSFYRFATTDEKGHFEIPRARPGEYHLFAFEELDQRSIQDPDFLKPFESFGVPVNLREGANDAQKLSRIPTVPTGAPQ